MLHSKPFIARTIAAGILSLCALHSATADPIVDMGAVSIGHIVLHTPEKRDQSARIESLQGRKALKIEWNNERSDYYEFAYTRSVPLPAFLVAKVRVQVFIPQNVQARNLGLRIRDKDGEVFQFSKPIPAGVSGWQEFVYDLNATRPSGGSWGAKANRVIDFPARFSGFASDFSSKTGRGYIGIGTVGIDIIKSNQPLQPKLETGSPVHVLTPQWKGPFGIRLANTRAVTVEGEINIKVEDAYGQQISNESRKVKLVGKESRVFELKRPKAFGVYYVDVAYRENDPQLKSFEKRFSYSYMQPSGPTKGLAEGFLFGVCAHPLGIAPHDQKLEALAAALCGVKIMRTDISWSRMQPSPDRWNFKPFDQMVEAFAAQNIEVQAIYSYLPQWAVAKDWKPYSNEVKGKPRPEYGYWRTFVRTFAERYHDRIRYVEVWNEPDHLGFANFPVSDYIEMLKIAYEESKKSDPDMIVLTGGYTGMPSPSIKIQADHMRQTLVKGRGFYDVQAFHAHGSFSSYRSQVEALLKLHKELRVNKPWYANETAISSIHIGELAQGQTLFQKFIYSWARGAIGYNWYDLRNDGFDPGNNEHNFGLITRDFYPKAAYGVYNMLASVFKGSRYVQDADCGRGIVGYFFRSASGDLLLPFWKIGFEKADIGMAISGVTGDAYRIDLFGNEEKLAVNNGILLLNAGTHPVTLRFTGQRTLPKTSGSFVRKIDEFICWPGHTREARLELSNPTNKSITYKLNFTLPEGLTMKKPVDSIRIRPGKSAIFTMKVDVAKTFRLQPGKQQDIRLHLVADSVWDSTLSFEVFPVIVAGKSFPDDDEPNFVLDHVDQVSFLAPNDPGSAHLFWTGPKDLSARIYLGHDAKNLLLKVDVTDDIHHQPYGGPSAWMADNVQLALQLPKQESMWEIGLTRLADGKSEVAVWLTPSGFKAEDVVKAVKLETSRSEQTRVTSYLAKIPFDAIGMDAATRKNGFRFNLLVNDNDGQMRESYIAITSGIGDRKSPEPYPFVLLNNAK